MAIQLSRDPSRISQVLRQTDGQLEHESEGRNYIYAPGFIRFWIGDSTETDDAKRLKKAQADLAEEKLKALRGETIPANQVAADYAAVGGAIRARLESLCPHCQELMIDGLSSVKELGATAEQASDGGGNKPSENGKAKSPPAKATRKRSSKASAKQS